MRTIESRMRTDMEFAYEFHDHSTTWIVRDAVENLKRPKRRFRVPRKCVLEAAQVNVLRAIVRLVIMLLMAEKKGMT